MQQLGNIKTAVKRFGFSDDDPLTDWINHGLLNFVAMAFPWPFLQATPYTDVLGAGQSSLVLPADLSRIITIKDMTPGVFKALTAMERTEFEHEVGDPEQEGMPTNYVMTGLTSVDVWPIPTQDTTFRVVYLTSIPKLVNDTDESEIPDELDYAVVQAAAATGLQAENEEERSANAEQQAQNSCARVWNRFSGSATRDRYRRVKDTAGYGR